MKDTQHNDIQRNGLNNDIQHNGLNDTQHERLSAKTDTRHKH